MVAKRKSSKSPPPTVAALSDLVRAALDLGVGDASRRLAGAEHALPLGNREARIGHVAQGLHERANEDPLPLVHLVKEVWSRGEVAHRRTAARAVGATAGLLPPHTVVGLVRELSTMSTTAHETSLIGEEAIAPLLCLEGPPLDRVNGLVRDPQSSVRRAALAGIMSSARNRDVAVDAALGAALPAALIDEDGSRALRPIVRELAALSASGATRALGAWVQDDAVRFALAQPWARSAGLKLAAPRDPSNPR